jgi:hypothetical protein
VLLETEWAELAFIAAPDAAAGERARLADLADDCHATYLDRVADSGESHPFSFAWRIRQEATHD